MEICWQTLLCTFDRGYVKELLDLCSSHPFTFKEACPADGARGGLVIVGWRLDKWLATEHCFVVNSAGLNHCFCGSLGWHPVLKCNYGEQFSFWLRRNFNALKCWDAIVGGPLDGLKVWSLAPDSLKKQSWMWWLVWNPSLMGLMLVPASHWRHCHVSHGVSEINFQGKRPSTWCAWDWLQ